MNFAESRYVEEKLLGMGYEESKSAEDADLVVVNGCSVREHAQERTLGWLKSLSKERKKVLAMGCLAAHVPQKLYETGADTVSYIIDFSEFEISDGQKTRVNPKIPEDRLEYEIPIVRGCDRFCTYCIVPYLRGKVVSRRPEEILREIESCVLKGGAVFNLLGQNVNRYDYGGYKLSDLLRDVSDISGVMGLTFTTSHPADLTEGTVRVVAEKDNIFKYFHLPFQSASDRLLKRMARGYDSKKYLADIEMIRDIYPKMRISTDVMVGLPGETQEDFIQTIGFVERLRFDEAYMYAYSPRKGTLDNLAPDLVEKNIRKKRLVKLIDVQRNISLEKKKEKIGTFGRAILTSKSRFGGYSFGMLFDMSPVLTDAEFRIGRMLDLEIKELKGGTLFGQPV